MSGRGKAVLAGLGALTFGLGALTATILTEVPTGLLGPGAWLLAGLFVLAGVSMLRGRGYGLFRAAGDGALVVSAASASSLLFGEGGGGLVGDVLGDAAALPLGRAGGTVLFMAIILLVVAERLPLRRMFGASLKVTRPAARPRSLQASDDAVPACSQPETEPSDFETDEREEDLAFSQTLPSFEPPAPEPRKASRRSVVSRFELPSSSLLSPARADAPPSGEQLREEASILEGALASYDVECKVESTTVGPTVVTFEGKVAPGTKISKVVGLAGDLAMAFGRKVRVAIGSRPGRLAFEVERSSRSPVGLRELCEDDGFRQSRAALPVVLGRGVRGEAVFADIAEMPHAIVAGATGSGKSVALSAMLCSLLMRRGPDELRLVLIDPKVVELQPYGRIPHMLLPVVTDMGKAMAALRWAVSEMERRYQALAAAGCKNLASFNAKARAGERMPHIVIVVDEFADFIASQGKAAEALVARLAQKARAAGIHLVLATQRPSVDVITGTIKANFPTRIALRVAQKVDSRTILDDQGAEHLLGRGDMLVKLGGSDALVRVQCPMVTEEEVEAVCGALSSQGMPSYDESILAEEEPASEEQPRPRARGGAKVWS